MHYDKEHNYKLEGKLNKLLVEESFVLLIGFKYISLYL